MSMLTSSLCRGYRCDGHGCERVVRGEWSTETFYLRDAVGKGWTVWRGRTDRVYCPEHGPQPGHRMREITHHYRDRETS